MSRPTWYRNVGRRRYHAARPDWIDSRLAVCGARIEASALTTNGIGYSGFPEYCLKCRKATGFILYDRERGWLRKAGEEFKEDGVK